MRILATIKSKFIVTMLIVVFLPCTLITVYFYQSTEDQFTLRIRETLEITRHTYENTVNHLVRKGLDYAEFFIKDRSIREAVFYTTMTDDNSNLLAILEAYYTSLDLNNIEFISQDGIVLARGHLPEKFNDSKKDFPFTQQMITEQKKRWNYEIEERGITLKFGSPVFIGHDFVGFVGYGYYIDHDFLFSVKQVVNAELVFILKHDESIVATTYADITTEQLDISALRESLNGTEKLEIEKTIGDQIYSILYVPVLDAEQQVFGTMCVLQNMTHTVNAYRKNLFVSILLVTCAVFFALAIGFFITNSITKPVNEAVTHLKTIAEGDLTHQIDVTSTGEIGELLMAMQRMAQTLGDVVASVKEGADTVANGGQQMRSSAARMSQGAAEQAAAAEEASASMEEMVANIRQNADNASHTEKIAVQTAEDARRSGQTVTEAVGAMREIAQKITIIEDITRQTRMLSLNATIEAARAKNKGKGLRWLLPKSGRLPSGARRRPQRSISWPARLFCDNCRTGR